MKLIQNHSVLREYQCTTSLLVSWTNTVWPGDPIGHGYNIDVRSCGDQWMYWIMHIIWSIDPVNIDPVVSICPWGGLPFVYSCSDSAQLPAVLMKALCDKSPARPGTSDSVGKIAIQNFLNPVDITKATSTVVVVMDEVLRQGNCIWQWFILYL